MLEIKTHGYQNTRTHTHTHTHTITITHRIVSLDSVNVNDGRVRIVRDRALGVWRATRAGGRFQQVAGGELGGGKERRRRMSECERFERWVVVAVYKWKCSTHTYTVPHLAKTWRQVVNNKNKVITHTPTHTHTHTHTHAHAHTRTCNLSWYCARLDPDTVTERGRSTVMLGSSSMLRRSLSDTLL